MASGVPTAIESDKNIPTFLIFIEAIPQPRSVHPGFVADEELDGRLPGETVRGTKYQVERFSLATGVESPQSLGTFAEEDAVTVTKMKDPSSSSLSKGGPVQN